jgi:hypothetical protein
MRRERVRPPLHDARAGASRRAGDELMRSERGFALLSVILVPVLVAVVVMN